MVAYIDPGSGSMVAQVVVAGAAGVAVAAKMGWRKAALRIRSMRLRDDPAPDEAPSGR
jgi:hypothetical protein